MKLYRVHVATGSTITAREVEAASTCDAILKALELVGIVEVLNLVVHAYVVDR